VVKCNGNSADNEGDVPPHHRAHAHPVPLQPSARACGARRRHRVDVRATHQTEAAGSQTPDRIGLRGGLQINDQLGAIVDPENFGGDTTFSEETTMTADATNTTPTVETALDALSEAVRKAADDFRESGTALDRARQDIASHNTSISREVVVAAVRAVDHLKQVDEALRDVLQRLAERD